MSALTSASQASSASAASVLGTDSELNLGDEMNPKRVYGSYTLIGIIVVRIYDPDFSVHFVPKEGTRRDPYKRV